MVSTAPLISNRYERIKSLGRGATSEVVLCRDSATGKECALKLLRTQQGSVSRVIFEGFGAEFSLLRDLRHPSVARVFDAGQDTDTGRLFIATEYVSGKNLFDATENSSFEQVLSLFIQSLRAFNYLHQRGVIHLDIKPDNLLVCESDAELKLKVIDFGFANFYSRDEREQDQGNAIVGTAAYVAPEILRKETPDARADLYSLGCTFYRAFTRDLPFKGDDEAQVHDAHLKQNPIAPSLVINNGSRPKSWLRAHSWFDSVILRLLEKDPAKRYQNAAEVLEDLHLLTGMDIPVETSETAQSYFPDSGPIVGFEEEKKIFNQLWRDRIESEAFAKKSYLFIEGKLGSGKSRLIEYFRTQALRKFVAVLSWDVAKKISVEELQKPCLILADDSQVDEFDIDYIDCFYEKEPVIVVISGEKAPTGISESCLIKLKPLQRNDVAELLRRASGLWKIPETLLEIVWKHTQGHPETVIAYIRELLSSGLLRDHQGSWSEALFEQFSKKIESSSARDIVIQNLKNHLAGVALSPDQKKWLTLFSLSSVYQIDFKFEVSKEDLDHLAEILRKNIQGQIEFTHSLYPEAFLDFIPQDEKEKIGESIGPQFLKDSSQSQYFSLILKSLGTSSEALRARHELIQLLFSRGDVASAERHLVILYGEREIENELRDKVSLQLARIAWEKGEYARAEEIFLSLSQKKGEIFSEDIVDATEGLGQCKRIAQGDFKKARQIFSDCLCVLENKNVYPDLRVMLKNRIAQTYADEGQTEKAEELFVESLKDWRELKTDQQKIRALQNDLDLILYERGECAHALELLGEFFKVVEKSPEHEAYPRTLYKMARCYLRLGDVNNGERLLKNCRDELKKRVASGWLFSVTNELANLTESRGDIQSAIELYEQALALARRGAPVAHIALISTNIAAANLKLGELEIAKKYFEYALRLVEKLSGGPREACRVTEFLSYIGLSEIWRKLDSPEKSIFLMREAEPLLSHSFFVGYAQYYWQEMCDIAKMMFDDEAEKKAMAKLGELKQQPTFDWTHHKNWQQQRGQHVMPGSSQRE